MFAELLHKDLVVGNITSTTKAEALAEMLAPLEAVHPEIDRKRAHRILLEREGLGTTGIGDGIAIPHGKLAGLESIVVVAGRSPSGVPFDALDHKPCHIFIMVLAPEDAAGAHLRVLSQISRLLKDQTFRDTFLAASDSSELYGVLHSAARSLG